MYDLFIEFTNQIFWEGYAETLAEENPQAYNFEFENFLNTYGHGA